mgnify:CR=1 FL=1
MNAPDIKICEKSTKSIEQIYVPVYALSKSLECSSKGPPNNVLARLVLLQVCLLNRLGIIIVFTLYPDLPLRTDDRDIIMMG